jgi:glycosyltransferase involved in cell wall biosynthesis
MKISVITTAYNEEGNIAILCRRIKKAMGEKDYEVIMVDDGSADRTYDELAGVKDARFRAVRLKEHKGKCFALYEGIRKSCGDVIATLDADLQNDPHDIVKMTAELEYGHDFICGWRRERKDGSLKKISSKAGNLLNNMILGVGLHDNNCPVKVFRRECVAGVKYFRNYHRFIPAMAKLQGYKIKEKEVAHFPRVYGASKYGIHNRIFGNARTMFAVKFRHRRLLEWS